MRAIIVELISDGPPTEISGVAAEVELDESGTSKTVTPTPAEGTLEERKISREEYDSNEGEPW
jgi:hypothetical protein